MFWNTDLKILKLYETYKSLENFGEFSYLAEKFTVAVQGIFSRGTLGPVKYYQEFPAGGILIIFNSSVASAGFSLAGGGGRPGHLKAITRPPSESGEAKFPF